ncbi:MAG TPA: helix-turn-helix transcriptional regulator [Candidatus Sulfotelmatobacter sp.]|nr:helix-turn-helix transcriptional regulator [Candidatus Sulfotelmatobacter sp.]
MPAHAESRTTTARRSAPAMVREKDFLELLGERVRHLRARSGATRKALARKARVSERHLAQLEAGEGNVSIVLLRRIAAALHISLTEFFTPIAEAPAERQMIERLLEKLPANRREDVVRRLTREFGPEVAARRTCIALVGLRGAGKSTLGAKLGAEMKIPFIELDQEIEKQSGMPLTEIFSMYGQSGFRGIERRALERVLAGHDRMIVSVGGGIVTEPETFDYLLANCFTVWIKAAPEEHMSRVIAQGDFRPIAGSNRAMEDLRRILEAREPLYRKADIYLDTTRNTVEESFAKLTKAIQASVE